MKFYKAGEIPNIGNMYFIYGNGGTGKTSLSRVFPTNNKKKLLLSFDKSTNVISDTTDTDAIAFGLEDAPQMQNLVMYWLNKLLYKTDSNGSKILTTEYSLIVIDNVTALQNWVIANVEGASKDGRANWNKVQQWFRELGDYLRETELPVLATAHMLTDKDVTIGTIGKYKPDMNDKTFNAFMADFDVVGRIYKKDGERLIDMDPEQENQGKNRIDNRTLIKADDLLIKTDTEIDTKTEEQEEK